jgi:hypothetical protein
VSLCLTRTRALCARPGTHAHRDLTGGGWANNRRVDALAERMLVEMASSVVPALASGTAEAAWVDFEQDLHSTAAVAKQAAITDQVQIPECLHFLCEYSQLHRELAQLQGHKARVTSSEEQALPELQETVEKGVDCAVARLMPMFGAPPRFWALLLLAVRQLCGICNPAFDRDEVSRHRASFCLSLRRCRVLDHVLPS